VRLASAAIIYGGWTFVKEPSEFDYSKMETRVKQARFQGRVIDGAEGVDLKEQYGNQLDFRCVECGNPARVERAGGHMPHRFEHLERNDHCSLVHRRTVR